MNKSIIKIIVAMLLFTSVTTLFAQSKRKTKTPKMPANTKVFYVNAERAKCEGVTTMQCLMVKKPGQNEYELFYDNIEGFNFEEGNNYTIWVREELKTPPIGVNESLYKYVYVKTVSKKAVSTTTNTTSTKNDNSKPQSGMNYSKQTTLVVNEEKTTCDKDAKSQCLLIKKDGAKEFEIFNREIDGFVFEPGYRQTILVYESYIANAPVTDAGPAYSLVKVISKVKINNMATTGGKETALVINEEKGPCEGNPDAKCLLIKKDGAKEFEVFYQGIEGFNFEEGYRQTILVFERYVQNTMVKQATPIYTYLKTISKLKVKDVPFVATATSPKAPIDKKWILKKMKESDTSSFAIDDNGAWIEFNSAENRYNGKAPCNTFFGGFKSDLISSFESSAPASTRMYCANMQLEDLFFKLLQGVNSFQLKDGKLTLLKDGKWQLEFE